MLFIPPTLYLSLLALLAHILAWGLTPPKFPPKENLKGYFLFNKNKFLIIFWTK